LAKFIYKLKDGVGSYPQLTTHSPVRGFGIKIKLSRFISNGSLVFKASAPKYKRGPAILTPPSLDNNFSFTFLVYNGSLIFPELFGSL